MGENGQPIQYVNENGEPVQMDGQQVQYAMQPQESVQYVDENGQPIQYVNENGEPVQMDGQPIQYEAAPSMEGGSYITYGAAPPMYTMADNTTTMESGYTLGTSYTYLDYSNATFVDPCAQTAVVATTEAEVAKKVKSDKKTKASKTKVKKGCC